MILPDKVTPVYCRIPNLLQQLLPFYDTAIRLVVNFPYLFITNHLMNYIIIDDHETDRMLITALAQNYPDMHLLGSFEHALDAVSSLSVHSPDLLFLDIEMPFISGIDFLRTLQSPPVCIFITSHPDFAVEAFELFALDYILKPITEPRFDAAIARAKTFLDIKQKALQYEHHMEQDAIVVHEGYNTHRILLSDILYLEALKDYTRIFTKEKSYITLGNLSRTLEELNIPHFKRVHRSYAVNAHHLLSIIENNIRIEDKTIPIGKTYRSAVNELKKRH